MEAFWANREKEVQQAINRTGFSEFSQIHTETIREWQSDSRVLNSTSIPEQIELLKRLTVSIRSQYREKYLLLAPIATAYKSKQIQHRVKNLFAHYQNLSTCIKERLEISTTELNELEKRLVNLDLSKLDQYCLTEYKEQCVVREQLLEKPIQLFTAKYPFLQLVAFINASPLEKAIADLAIQIIESKYEAYYRLAFCLGDSTPCPVISFYAKDDIIFLRRIDQICGRTGSSSNGP